MLYVYFLHRTERLCSCSLPRFMSARGAASRRKTKREQKQPGHDSNTREMKSQKPHSQKVKGNIHWPGHLRLSPYGRKGTEKAGLTAQDFDQRQHRGIKSSWLAVDSVLNLSPTGWMKWDAESDKWVAVQVGSVESWSREADCSPSRQGSKVQTVEEAKIGAVDEAEVQAVMRAYRAGEKVDKGIPSLGLGLDGANDEKDMGTTASLKRWSGDRRGRDGATGLRKIRWDRRSGDGDIGDMEIELQEMGSARIVCDEGGFSVV